MPELIMSAKPAKRGFTPMVSRDGGNVFEDVDITAPTEEEALAIAQDYIDGHSKLTMMGRSSKRTRKVLPPETLEAPEMMTPDKVIYKGLRKAFVEVAGYVVFYGVLSGIVVLFNKI